MFLHIQYIGASDNSNTLGIWFKIIGSSQPPVTHKIWVTFPGFYFLILPEKGHKALFLRKMTEVRKKTGQMFTGQLFLSNQFYLMTVWEI